MSHFFIVQMHPKIIRNYTHISVLTIVEMFLSYVILKCLRFSKQTSEEALSLPEKNKRKKSCLTILSNLVFSYNSDKQQ